MTDQIDLSDLPLVETESALGGALSTEAPQGVPGLLDGLPRAVPEELRQQYRGLKEPPDQAAKVLKLSERTGIPDETVRNRIAEVERLANEPDWDEFEANAPRSAELMVKDLELFKLAHDVPEELSRFEQLVSQFKGGFYQAQAGDEISATARAASAGLLGAQQPLGPANLGEVAGPPRAPDSGPTRFIKGANDRMSQIMRDTGQNVDVMRARIGGFPGPEMGGDPEIRAATGRAVAETKIAEAIRNLTSARQQYQSPEVKAFVEAEGPGPALSVFAESPITTTLDLIATSGYPMLAAVGGAIAGGPAGWMGRAAGKYLSSYDLNYNARVVEALSDEGINPADPAAVAAALRDPALVRRVTQRAFRYATPIAAFDSLAAIAAGAKLASTPLREAAAQTTVQGVFGGVGEALGQVSDTGDIQSWGEVIAEGIAEIPGGVIEPGAYHLIDHLRGEQRVVDAEAFKNRVTELTELANRSKLRERSPQKFEQVIDGLLGENADADVYINAHEFSEFFQSQGINPMEIAGQLTGVAAQLPEAMVRNGDIRIKASEYITRLGHTEYQQGLNEIVRAQPEAMSAKEATEWKATQQERFQQLVEQIDAEHEADTAWNESAKQVEDFVRDQIVSTGRFTPEVAAKDAALHGAMAKVLASKMNLQPHQVYEQFGLRVAGAPVVQHDGMQYDQQTGALVTDTPEFRNWFGDSKVVDESGKPLVVYHGSGSKGIESFDPSKAGEILKSDWGDGIYFTPSRWMADGYRLGAAKQLDTEANRLYQEFEDKAKEFGTSPMMMSIDLGFGSEKYDELKRYEVAWRNRLSEIEKGDLGETYGVYVSLQNPLYYTPQGITDPYLARSAKEKGHDGIIITYRDGSGIDEVIAFRPEQIKSATGNRGTFDPNDPNILFQGDAAPRLSVLHNLTPDNLKFADSIGGLAVPSLAVVRDDVPLEGYGEITLIGRRDLVDPKQGVKVFDADAYTSTFPEPQYGKPSATSLRKLLADLSPWAEKFGDREVLYYAEENATSKSDPHDTVSRMINSNAGKAWFLAENGISVEPVLQPVEPRWSFAWMPAWKNFVKSADWSADSMGWGSKERQTLLKDAGTAAKLAIREYVAKRYAKMNAADRRTTEKLLLDGVVSEDGSIKYSVLHSAKDDIKKIGQKRVSAEKTSNRLDKAIKGKESEFKSWVEKKIVPMYGEPRLTLRGRKVPYTLDNIVDFMTHGGVQAKEDTMTFGPGKARAASAVRIKDFQDMRKRAETQMASKSEINELRDKADKAMSAWREMVVDYYGTKGSRDFGRVWEGLDASMRAIAKWAKKGNLAAALRSEGFEGVPDYLVKEGEEAGRLLISAPVPYFEAKPERAVSLSEFAGAVIPAESSQEIKDILDRHGIRYRTYRKKFDEVERFKVVNELRNDLAAQGEDTLFQQQRGSIQFPADLTQAPSVINLLDGADLSTFLHETGHFFFEVYRTVASQPNAPESVVADMQALLEFVGVADLATWNSMSIEQRRDGHEKVARAFEAYLFEGKAPSPALTDLFRTFSRWLVNVYKSLRGLNVDLTPEVRGVFDRMLATEEEIKAVETLRQYAPLFESMEQAGMSLQDWAEYQALGQAATDAADSELQHRSLKDMRWLSNAKARELKRLQREADAKRRDVRTEAEAAIYATPIYAARRYLTHGDIEPPTPNQRARRLAEQLALEPGKLSKTALLQMYGDGPAAPWRYLSTGKYGLMAQEGIHPDELAELFGFDSGDALVRQLLEVPDPEAAIDARTDQMMLERYGDITSPAVLDHLADMAVHNEARLRFLNTELRALDQMMNARGDTGRVDARGRKISYNILEQAAREFAAQAIGRKKVRDAGKTGAYAAAETRAGKAAMDAMRKGDIQSAAEHKRAQVLNAHFFRAASKAGEEIDKIVRYLKKFDSEGTRKNLDRGYLDQIDQLLERVDLRKAPQGEVERRRKLAEWVAEQEEKGFAPAIDPALIDEARLTHYTNLTMDELRALRDAVKSIEHLGRLKKKLLTARDKREFDEVIEAAVASIEQNSRGVRPVEIETDLPQNRLRQGIGQFFASHRKIAEIFRQMDGDQDGGAMWSLLMQPLNEAMDREAVMKEEATVALNKLFLGLKRGGRLYQKEFIPEINASLTKMGRVAVALNLGNDINRARLNQGYGWTPQQIDAITRTLTKEDWDFVQGVWDLLGSYWPMIVAKELRVNGVAPEKVEAVPVVTPFGEYRGGYYPIKYDIEQSPKAHQDATAEAAKQAMRGARGRATARRGHLEQRVDEVNRPVRLSFSTIFEHLDQVIHELTLHEFLIDQARVLSDKRMQDAIVRHYGAEIYRQLTNAMTAVAAGDVPATLAHERVANWLRTGASIAAMGWKLTTAMVQPLGLTQSMQRIGPKWVFKGIGRAFTDAAHLESSYAWIAEKSPMMRLRGKTLQREINEIRNRIEKEGWFQDQLNKVARVVGAEQAPDVKNSYFWLIVKLQLLADVPTWIGQYEKSRAAGESEERAVALADQAVLDAQGGGQIKDLAAIQRGHPWWKLWTNFYSFFNTTYNRTHAAVSRTRWKSPASVGRLAVDLLLLYALPAALSTLLYELWRNECDGDEECLVRKLAKDQVTYALGTVVGLRELQAMFQPYGYGGPAGARAISEITKLGQQAAQGEIDEAFLRAANKAGGILFHYPAGQIDATARGVTALATGETERITAIGFGPPVNE